MTSPRTPNDARPDETDEKPGRLQLSPVQVAAGALAAVSSAVVLSFFGVAGTVIGAAMASIVSTVGSALYSLSLNRTSEQLRRAREQLGARTAQPARTAEDAATQVLPAHLDPRRAPAPRRRRVRWPRAAGYAVVVFAVAMAVVTSIELVGQRPVSALVGGTDTSSSRTTIGALTNASSSRDVPPSDSPPSSTPGAPATGQPGDGSRPSATPTGESAPQTPAPTTGGGRGGTQETESTSTAERSTTAPQTRAPQTQVPQTQAPQTQAPATQAPPTQAPQTGSDAEPTG